MGIAGHKPVVRSCIKLAARLIKNLDAQAGFWLDENEKSGTEQVRKFKGLWLIDWFVRWLIDWLIRCLIDWLIIGFKSGHNIPFFRLQIFTKSRNPILKGITDYLVEVGSAEEDEMAEEGEEKNGKDISADDNTPTIERDAELEKVLDRLLIYLRIVHSLDFYNTSDYPLEDEMPNRCGIIHVRGPPPPHPVSKEDGTSFFLLNFSILIIFCEKFFLKFKIIPLFSVGNSDRWISVDSVFGFIEWIDWLIDWCASWI